MSDSAPAATTATPSMASVPQVRRRTSVAPARVRAPVEKPVQTRKSVCGKPIRTSHGAQAKAAGDPVAARKRATMGSTSSGRSVAQASTAISRARQSLVASRGVRKETAKVTPVAHRQINARPAPRPGQKENVRNVEVFSTKLGDARRMAVSQMAQADGCALEAIGKFDKMLAELRGALVERLPSQSKPVGPIPDLFAEMIVQETPASAEPVVANLEPSAAPQATELSIQNPLEVVASTTPRVSFGRDGGI
mmetsp:Transcript_25056/g.60770  ORF Transcript_25056/g.60770 Transcript_25056/m.60770 type:complete len:251 (-) Transcript_25056:144-896(-)